MIDVKSVSAVYTGGNIWCFLGEYTDGVFFLADDDGRIMFFDSDPNVDLGTDEDCFSLEWQQKHEVSCEVDSKEFVVSILTRLLNPRENDDLGGITNPEIEFLLLNFKN